MSALDDITARLAQLKKPKRGAERTILVGISAQRSILCALDANRLGLAGLPETLNGFLVMTTNEFDGWEIRDCLASGRWVDAA
jgi:hypothetical protein